MTTQKDIVLQTDRLVLRPWRDEDFEPFAEMCADPIVMRFFPDVLTREKTRLLIEKAKRKTRDDGFCFGPIETRVDGEFLGFVGLNIPEYGKPLPFDPCVEVGWRLKQSAWGKGYASEAALEWLRFGFETLQLDEIVSFTIPANEPSQKVMKRIGMTRDQDGDFLHPALDPDHPIAPHVLYRLDKNTFYANQG